MTKKKNDAPKIHVNVAHGARNKEYKKVLEAIHAGGFCPFCEKNLMIHHKKKIHFKTKYWIVTENSWPYKATKYHFLIIYRPKHLCHIKDLSKEAILDKFSVEKKLCQKYKITGGTMMMRFGSSHDTGASVEHLHFHLVVANKKSKDYDPAIGVMARLG